MKRIMLDLETLDTGPNSTILSIGAVVFDEEAKGDFILDKFYVVAKPDQSEWNRTISARTIQWWMQQDSAARNEFNDPNAVRLDTALAQFTDFVVNNLDKTGQIEVWGNGADFDNVILGNAYKATGLRMPWSYAMNRCFRTLKNLGIPLKAGEGIVRGGTHHNALDDAIYQAHYAVVYLRKLETVAP